MAPLLLRPLAATSCPVHCEGLGFRGFLLTSDKLVDFRNFGVIRLRVAFFAWTAHVHPWLPFRGLGLGFELLVPPHSGVTGGNTNIAVVDSGCRAVARLEMLAGVGAAAPGAQRADCIILAVGGLSLIAASAR